jgi:hypothetical protein
MTGKKLSYHVATFSEKVRAMNQTNSKNLTLSAADARSLHADIFALLAKISALSDNSQLKSEPTSIKLDGGKF